MRRTRLMVGGLALVVSGMLFLGAVGGTAVGAEESSPRLHMLALTNHDRVRHDRSALSFAPRLATYAKSHSQAMVDTGNIFHSTAEQLVAALEGYHWELGGENIGVGDSLEGLEEAFMASREHRKNILRRIYDHAGVGIVRSDEKIWITVIFFG